ncbi:MAG: hypothetical protein ACLUD2_08855 [Clostridium sp.]
MQRLWAKLQDNVLEYDEIPDLAHVYNSSISKFWKTCGKGEGKIDRNIQESWTVSAAR